MSQHKTNLKEDAKTISDMAETMRRYGDGMTRDTLLQHYTSEEVNRFEAKARDVANWRAETGRNDTPEDYMKTVTA